MTTETPDNKTFYTKVAVTIGGIILVLVVVKFLFFRDGVSTDPESGLKVISWEKAGKHYGETCIVEGTIVVTHNSGKACFLSFHPNWKKYFTAVIFANKFDRFPSNPEDYYECKKVRVRGLIKEYNGKPEIILESPEQIEVVE